MPNVFLISDTHFRHKNICSFFTDDGSKMRPWDNVEEMDQTMADNWNSVVKPTDKVYHLGDVAIKNRRDLEILNQLHGKKVLIKGNHDIFKIKDYLPYFYDIRAYHVLDKMLLSHIPVNSGSLGKFKGNVHGHLHERVVRDADGIQDMRYKSVCVEQINYTPIELSEIQKYFYGVA